MNTKFTSDIKKNYDITVLGVYKNNKLSQPTTKFDGERNDIISTSIKNSKFDGDIGKSLFIYSEKLLLIGLGEQKNLDNLALQKIGGKIGSLLKSEKLENAFVMLDNFSDEKLFNLAYGANLKTYEFNKYKSEAKEHKLTLNFYSENPQKSEGDFLKTQSIIDGVITTRNLANEPSNILTTTEFVKQTKKLSKLGVKIEVIDEAELKKMGANLILAVGSGSSHPPYIVVMKYTGNKKSKNKIALIGKGLCFDSGGISLKPSKGMDEMKSDMTGAATVVGIMESLAKQKAKVNVVGIIGIAENMPDGNSYKPGDIIKSLSGKTVEVLDTDAEGRLVLADCITYTVQKIKPNLMIDFATLTGAIIVALGDETTGLFTNNEKLAKQLTEAGQKTGEEVWQLPMGKKYKKMIESDIADMKNLGTPLRSAGSITAAEFLDNFTDGTSWAHLDIAGTAWTTGNDIAPKGMTGVGINLINEFIETNIK